MWQIGVVYSRELRLKLSSEEDWNLDMQWGGTWTGRVWVAVRWFPWKERKKKKKPGDSKWSSAHLIWPLLALAVCLRGSGHLSKSQICAVPSHHRSFEHSLPWPCHFPPLYFCSLLRNLSNLCPFLTNTFLIPTKEGQIPLLQLIISVIFGGCAIWLAGSQFPHQGLNPGHGNESLES